MVSLGFFILPAALWHLTEMGTRNVSWQLRLTTLPPSCAECLDIGEPLPPGNLKAVKGLLYLLPVVFMEQNCFVFYCLFGNFVGVSDCVALIGEMTSEHLI